ncbi:hypothetical protein [Rhizobium sp. A37_96]
MGGAGRIDFLIAIECLSHFGQASRAKICCAAKIFTFQQKNNSVPDASSSAGMQISSDA